MDDFTYTYETSGGHTIRNRLLRVDDAVTDKAFDTDYDEPLASGDTYTYDAIGNLVKDKEAQIDTIIWTPSGKIQSITREAGVKDKPNLEFGYDAAGNRLWKKVIPNDGVSGITFTYYLRDAQGNIMATYGRYTQKSSPEGWSDYQRRQVVEVFERSEAHLYGSSRLGMVDQSEITAAIAYNGTAFDHENATFLIYLDPPAITDSACFAFERGRKKYELSNHLGNVMPLFPIGC